MLGGEGPAHPGAAALGAPSPPSQASATRGRRLSKAAEIKERRAMHIAEVMGPSRPHPLSSSVRSSGQLVGGVMLGGGGEAASAGGGSTSSPPPIGSYTPDLSVPDRGKARKGAARGGATTAAYGVSSSFVRERSARSGLVAHDQGSRSAKPSKGKTAREKAQAQAQARSEKERAQGGRGGGGSSTPAGGGGPPGAQPRGGGGPSAGGAGGSDAPSGAGGCLCSTKI
jgi:translation initiation factor IF-2